MRRTHHILASTLSSLVLSLSLVACGSDGGDDDDGASGTSGASGQGGSAAGSAGSAGTAGKGGGAGAGDAGSAGTAGSGAGTAGTSAGDAGAAGTAGTAGSAGDAGSTGDAGAAGSAGSAGGVGGVGGEGGASGSAGSAGSTSVSTKSIRVMAVNSVDGTPLFNAFVADKTSNVQGLTDNLGNATLTLLAGDTSLLTVTAEGYNTTFRNHIWNSDSDVEIIPVVPIQAAVPVDPTHDIDQTALLPNGDSVQLKIPANSLADGDGNPITGPVELDVTHVSKSDNDTTGGLAPPVSDKGEPLDPLDTIDLTAKAPDGSKAEPTPGNTVEVTVPASPVPEPEVKTYQMWVFNEETGLWELEDVPLKLVDGNWVTALPHLSKHMIARVSDQSQSTCCASLVMKLPNGTPVAGQHVSVVYTNANGTEDATYGSRTTDQDGKIKLEGLRCNAKGELRTPTNNVHGTLTIGASCDTPQDVEVDCTSSADCPGNAACTAGRCAKSCASDTDCAQGCFAEGAQVCNATTKQCTYTACQDGTITLVSTPPAAGMKADATTPALVSISGWKGSVKVVASSTDISQVPLPQTVDIVATPLSSSTYASLDEGTTWSLGSTANTVEVKGAATSQVTFDFGSQAVRKGKGWRYVIGVANLGKESSGSTVILCDQELTPLLRGDESKIVSEPGDLSSRLTFNHAGGETSGVALYTLRNEVTRVTCAMNATGGVDTVDYLLGLADVEFPTSCGQGTCGHSTACGDGILEPGYGEECDDGNTTAGDGCDASCKIEASNVCATSINLNTGSDGNGGSLTEGVQDPRWQVATVDNPQEKDWLPTYAHFNCGVTKWKIAPQGSAWINEWPDAGCKKTAAGKIIHYRIKFALPDSDSAAKSIRLAGTVWADDHVKTISVNGTAVTLPPGQDTIFTGLGADFGSWSSNLYKAGQNVIQIDVLNNADPSPPSPDGLLVAVPTAFSLGSECSTCGNGATDTNEQCDDKNHVNSDGCDIYCHTESCGDGKLTAGEECDDGNTTAGDGCDASCKIEAGRVCTNYYDVATANNRSTVDHVPAGQHDLHWTWGATSAGPWQPTFVRPDVKCVPEWHDATALAQWISRSSGCDPTPRDTTSYYRIKFHVPSDAAATHIKLGGHLWADDYVDFLALNNVEIPAPKNADGTPKEEATLFNGAGSELSDLVPYALQAGPNELIIGVHNGPVLAYNPDALLVTHPASGTKSVCVTGTALSLPPSP